MDSRLLDILVCPVSKGRLQFDRSRSELISRGAGLAYPVRDGIPILLESEARQLDDAPGAPATATPAPDTSSDTTAS
ncbi:Trm112 family protein [Achromobacter sp. KS-M25]|nr:Trm112 family protein [Achromobacter aestuarii]